MATVNLKGNSVQLKGTFPAVGSEAPDFSLAKSDLSELSLGELKGQRVVLNIFPSLDTQVCAMAVRKFNTMAAQMKNIVVLAISKDLPFAMGRFCTTEGINNVTPLSTFRNHTFGEKYGVEIADSPMAGLLARAVIIVDDKGKIIYRELVDDIVHEPNYDAALAALR